MAGFFRGAAEWLGLVNQDRYGDYYEADHELTEAVEDIDDETEASVTDIESRRPVTPGRPVSKTADLTRIITVHPRTYNEARVIGEHFRDAVPVIMNLSEMDDADAKRLVDFAAGLIFGLRGTIERVTGKVFLLSPQNVNVTAEDKERIAGGFYNQS